MKLFAALFAAIIFILIGHIGVAAASETATFQYQAGDIGTIKTDGPNKNAARSTASEECFDRRIDLFVQKRGELPDDAQAALIIDSCVNI
ncbi:MAG: hypothetical protein H6626_03305 [Pseudobdellovibrionaceae bacterium]|nr:hypothetical protein [Bdellovibrionales bacterium]USN48129.1 MAG: hypothetical protein H6626_03305 [Pseudobdellovibrionaceae bacterium]